MNCVQRKIYLYNVTFGLYMLDWWERYLFNTLVLVLMWFIFYNTSRYVTDFCKRHCKVPLNDQHALLYGKLSNAPALTYSFCHRILVCITI
ncbi:uncharacterized protein LOC125212012 isoform X2 [Salvia hispanica]|nr:uncharacterized protein LOC125212012 isoform X2 [Salvia hispanica]XP_047967972.1 uncharacterized protein LOC125212012 isoform X2 [Salvia hispanica]